MKDSNGREKPSRFENCSTCGRSMPTLAMLTYRVPGQGAIKRCRPCDKNLKPPQNAEVVGV